MLALAKADRVEGVVVAEVRAEDVGRHDHRRHLGPADERLAEHRAARDARQPAAEQRRRARLAGGRGPGACGVEYLYAGRSRGPQRWQLDGVVAAGRAAPLAAVADRRQWRQVAVRLPAASSPPARRAGPTSTLTCLRGVSSGGEFEQTWSQQVRVNGAWPSC